MKMVEVMVKAGPGISHSAQSDSVHVCFCQFPISFLSVKNLADASADASSAAFVEFPPPPCETSATSSKENFDSPFLPENLVQITIAKAKMTATVTTLRDRVLLSLEAAFSSTCKEEPSAVRLRVTNG